MLSPRAALAALVTAGLLTALEAPSAQTGQAPQNPPVFRGATTLVPLDIRVLDRSGKPVTDLTQSDFTVLENGVPQAIRHFSSQELTATTATAPATTPGAGGGAAARAPQADEIAVQNRRIFLIVLARGRLNDVSKGVDGMLHFVRERLLPQDLVAVLAWNRATAFTTDHARIVTLLERFKHEHKDIESKMALRFSGLAGLYGSREIPPSLQAQIDAVFGGPGARGVRSVQPGASPNAARLNGDLRDVLEDMIAPLGGDPTATPDLDRLGATLDEFVASSAQTMQDLGNLYVGVEYLRHIAGEKHLVFVSALGLALPRAEDDLDLAAAASDARVVIDYIHTSGTPMSAAQQTFSAEHRTAAMAAPQRPAMLLAAPAEIWRFATARNLADRTGGRFYGNQFPNAAADMDRIDQATRFGYTLGYYASNPAMDGKYRRITVRVNRPGLTVLYRHGYFARPQLGPINLERRITYSRIAAAANYAGAVPDIGVQATARTSKATDAGGGAGVQLDIRLDPSRLTFTTRDGRNVKSIELAVFLVDDGDRLVGELWKTVELAFTDERLAILKRDGVTIGLTISTSAPPKNAKVVVYDAGDDLLGSTIVKVQ